MKRIVLVAAALLAVLLPGTPAWAHTALVSADPPRNATLSKAPTAVTLTFSQKINPDFTTIVLSDTAARRIPASPPAVDDADGTITIGQPLGNGVYTVAYRVVSTDGHTVQDSYTFTVADPALPAATTAARTSEPAAAPSADSGAIPTLALIGVAAAGLLLAVLAAYFVLSGRKRATRAEAQERR